MTDAPRPTHGEIAELATEAAIGASPVQADLMVALLRYLEITGAYVRSGRSAPVMQEAFDAGVAAIRAAADGFIRESTKSDGAAPL